MPSNSNIRTNDPTKVPALPKIPTSVTPELRRYLETLEQVTNIRLGRRGDPRDRAITLRELITSGLAQELAASPFNPNGTGTGFVPAGNTLVDLAVPPAPTGFTVTGAFSVINMSWNLANYGNHSHTEVWSHTSDVIGNATLTGITQSRVFSDPVGSGQTRYYWVRHVNTDNVAGPFNASAGTVGQTAADVNHLLGVLTGAITASELAQALEDRIDLIDAAATVTNSVAYRVAQEATARANEIAAIVTDVPVYSSTAAYAVDQIVRISNTDTKLYICIQAVGANSSVAITDTAYWKLYGDYAVLKSATDSAAADITEINTIATTSTSAAALAIKSLQTSVNDPSSGLSATAGALSTLQSAVNHSETGLSATVTDLTNLETALFDDLLDLAAWSNTANYAVDARVKHNQKAYRAIQASTSSSPKTPGVDTSFWALDTIAYASALTALSTTLTNDYSTTTQTGLLLAGKEDAGHAAGLISTSEATAAATYATSTTVDAQYAAIFTEMTGVADWSSSTSYTTGARVIYQSGNPSLKRIYRALQNSQNRNPASQTSYWQLDTLAYAAAVSSLESTVNASGSGLVDKVDGVELRLANAGGTSTNITMEQKFSAQATDIGDLEAQYTVKVDANGYVSGFGLANTVNNGTPTSEFFVNADRFAILPDRATSADPTWAVGVAYANGARVKYSGNLYIAMFAHTSASGTAPSATSSVWAQADLAPFAVQATGATAADGTYIRPGVYMESAFIKNGSIASAKIGSLAVDKITGTFAQFQSVVTGNLDANRINLDNTTLTSINVPNGDGTSTPTLAVNAISADKITTGTLNANNVTVSNLDATDINGDINVFDAVNSSMYVNLSSANVYYQILDQTLAAPDISHQVMASVVMQATKSQSGGTQVDMKITMTPTGGSTTTVFEGGHDHNFSNGSISQAAAGSLSSTTTTSVRVQVYAKKHGKGVVVTKIQGFIGGIR